jgi:hypothetical protein
MPCTDPRDVTRLDEAFDLTTSDILQWELELIWTAEERGLLVLSDHAKRAAQDEAIPVVAVHRIVRSGIPRSKDVSRDSRRQVGINFEGKRRRGGWLQAKVTWHKRYLVATVHGL